jgi:hypothetical protein
MPEIGNLLVSLQMETAQFNKGIADANNKLTGLGRQFANVNSTIQTHTAGITGAIGKITTAVKGLATVSALTSVAGWVRGMADSAEKAENLAAALGLTVPEFLKFDGALRTTGASADEAGRVLTTLSGKLREALTDPTGDAAKSFEQLGISQEQLKAKSNDLLGVMDLLADAWKRMPDGPQKTALFADLLSTRFRVLVGFMKDGSAGAREMMAEFERLNPGFLAAHEAANKVDATLDKLDATIRGLAGDTLAMFSGEIQRFVADLQEMAKSIQEVLRFLNTIKNLAHGSDVATAEIPPLPPSPRPPPPPPRSKGGGGKRRGGGGGGGGGGAGKAEAEARRLAREAERAREDAQREAIEAQEELNRISDERFRRAEQALKHDLAMDRLTKQESIAAEEKMLEQKWAATKGYYEKKLAAAVADKDETRKLQSAEKLDYERFITEREALNQESALETRNKWKEVFSDIGDSIKSSLGGAFDQILEGTFKLRDAIGNLLKDIGKKLADKALSKLFDMSINALGGLFGGGSSGGIPGSLVGAFAGGRTSKLDFSGYATGGSFRVGGAGALDSQLVAFRASPGEMVDVTRQGEARRGGETIRIDLNPSEGWVAGVADQRIVTRSGQIVEVAVRQSQRTVARNFGGMSAEAQARQL